MKILYADGWMVDALAAAGLANTTLLDLPALLNTLSADDVAFYVDVNKNLEAFLPKELVKSFEPTVFNLQGAENDRKLRAVVDAQVGAAVRKRAAIPADAKDEDKVLTCDLLGADTLLFRHISKTKEVTPVQQQSHLAERVLRQLAALGTRFEQLAVLPVMRWYLDARTILLTPNRIV